jgi:predicted small integral membrane protein
MLETTILIAQTVSVAAIAAWLSVGVYGNLRYPLNNELYTAQVMSMERLRAEYPEEFARVGHRAVTNRRVQLWAFRLAVLAELAAVLLLIAGVATLVLALAGSASVETGKTIAMLGALVFTSIWAGFLIVGDYFSYWFCHEGTQATHYHMTFWGMANMIFLTVA